MLLEHGSHAILSDNLCKFFHDFIGGLLEIAWHNMKDIDPKDEDDAYNAIGDVCSEHISIAEEACKKIEEESATASKLLLTSEDISKVCVEINLCEPRTMSTYH